MPCDAGRCCPAQGLPNPARAAPSRLVCACCCASLPRESAGAGCNSSAIREEKGPDSRGLRSAFAPSCIHPLHLCQTHTRLALEIGPRSTKRPKLPSAVCILVSCGLCLFSSFLLFSALINTVHAAPRNYLAGHVNITATPPPSLPPSSLPAFPSPTHLQPNPPLTASPKSLVPAPHRPF